MTTTTLTLCTDPVTQQEPRHSVWLAAMAILAMMFFSPLSLTAQVPDPHAMSGRDKIQTALLAKLESETQSATTKTGSQPAPQYPVIVSLQSPQTLQGKVMDYRSRDGLSQLQQHVEAMQNTVLQTPTSGSLTVLHRYQNVFGFSAMADREAIFSLVARDNVIRIEDMPVMHKMDTESHALTHVDRVHDLGYSGDGVTIAIIDDGIDAAHEAFGGDSGWPNQKIIGGYDFADGDNDPRIDCVEQNHGTAVAGVAAGNGGGIRGTAPDAKLVFLKVQHAVDCDQRQFRGDLIGAVDWAITNRSRYGIDIISMSLGGGASPSACDQDQPLLHQVLSAARQSGLIVLAASGNEAQTNAISSPACMPDVISVGAVYDDNIGPRQFGSCSDPVTHADLVTCYSNSAGILDILAPADCSHTAQAGGGTVSCFNGTSSATPFAAGVVATLLEAADEPLDNEQMRSALVNSGVAVSDPKSGWIIPRIDAEAALRELSRDHDDDDDSDNHAPCRDCGSFTGRLTGTGDWQAQPDDTPYFSEAGTHQGWLRGPSDADFDLYLLKFVGHAWVTVAASESSDSDESITYRGTSGYYIWVIYAYDGHGSYRFWLKQP